MGKAVGEAERVLLESDLAGALLSALNDSETSFTPPSPARRSRALKRVLEHIRRDGKTAALLLVISVAVFAYLVHVGTTREAGTLFVLGLFFSAFVALFALYCCVLVLVRTLRPHSRSSGTSSCVATGRKALIAAARTNAPASRFTPSRARCS